MTSSLQRPQIGDIPNSPHPREAYSDPYVAIIMHGKRGYAAAAQMLVNRERVAFSRRLVTAVALSSAANDDERATIARQLDEVPAGLVRVITKIAKRGLDNIDPDDVLRVLRSPAALLEVFSQIDCSDSRYWDKYKHPDWERPPWFLVRIIRGYGAYVALAASVFVILGLVVYGQSQVHAQSKIITELRATIDDLVRRISDSGAGRQVSQPSQSAFQNEFERARSFQPRSYPNQSKLGLVFYPFIGPPYYVAVRATWNGDHSQWIYRAGREPLEPEVMLDFTDLAPKSGEQRITLVLEFHTTEEAMQKVDEIGPMIRRSIPLVVSATGVRVASADDDDVVAASISAPTKEQQVDERFVMEMTLQRPASEQNMRRSANRMVHVLVRPLDSSTGWHDQYYVVPFRKRAAEISAAGETHTLAISLHGIVETIPLDQRPKRFELLVVDVPFQLEGWTVGKNVVDFDLQETKKMVRDRITLSLRRSEDDAQ